jgi:hypothetical protein
VVVVKKLLLDRKMSFGDEEEDIEIPDPTTSQLFEIVLAARKTLNPSVTLLYSALQSNRPLLAVIAGIVAHSMLDSISLKDVLSHRR